MSRGVKLAIDVTPGENLHSRALITNYSYDQYPSDSRHCRRHQLDHVPHRFESGRSELSHFFLKTRKPLVDDHHLAFPLFTYNEELGDEMQTPKDTRSIEAKRLDELALQYRTTRDPEVLTEMRALARRLSQANQ
jgi:hypothetical protein